MESYSVVMYGDPMAYLSASDIESYANHALLALAVPFVITVAVSSFNGNFKPVEFAQLLIYGSHTSGSLQVAQNIQNDFMYFTGFYFGAISATVGGLMVYNLLKMFGLDMVINDSVKNFLEWFTDTKAVVGSKGDVEDDETANDEVDPDQVPQ